jgi:uncharacterized protein (DUF305 family)
MNKKTFTIAITILILVIVASYLLVQNKSVTQVANYSNITTNSTTQSSTVLTVDPANKAFVDYVIPHHTDALDSSATLLASSKDNEFNDILKSVIAAQGKEVSQLKDLHQKWFNKPYKYNGSYEKMMKPASGTELEVQKAYLEGMISHHSSIIDFAKKTLTDSTVQYQPEILELSKAIISGQETQNQTFKALLETKYKEVVSMQNAMDHGVMSR